MTISILFDRSPGEEDNDFERGGPGGEGLRAAGGGGGGMAVGGDWRG